MLITQSISRLRGLRFRAEYLAALLLLRVLAILPKEVSLMIASMVAAGAYLVMSQLRRIANRNLTFAFPQQPKKQKLKLIWRVFMNFGRLLVEFSRLPKLNRENISEVVVYEGFENFSEALRRGKGTLFLTAHFGAWELCPFAHALYGYPLKFVVRPIDNPYLDRLVTSYRTMSGNQIIQKRNSLKELLRALKKRESVGILIDQNTTREAGVFVDFFGKPASAIRGPVTLALKTDAPIVFSLDVRQPDNRHHVLILPAIDLAISGNLEQDVQTNTVRILKILEGYIRQYPGQWLWLHNRWKTPPDAKWQTKRQIQRRHLKRDLKCYTHRSLEGKSSRRIGR